MLYCDISQDKLAQTVGQPQWMVDAVMQGKVTNRTSVMSILKPLEVIEEAKKEKEKREEKYLSKDNIPSKKQKKKKEKTTESKTWCAVGFDNKDPQKSKRKKKLPTKKHRQINWRDYETYKSVESARVRKTKKKEWEESRKIAQALMDGSIVLKEPPQIYPEPSFVKERYAQYEKTRLIGSDDAEKTTMVLKDTKKGATKTFSSSIVYPSDLEKSAGVHGDYETL